MVEMSYYTVYRCYVKAQHPSSSYSCCSMSLYHNSIYCVQARGCFAPSIQCRCSISVENYEFYLFVYVLSSDTGAYVCDSVQMCTCVLVYASECTYIGVVWGRHAAPSFYCLQCSSVVAEHGDQR